MKLEEFLDRLDGQKNHSMGNWRCRCPAHEDHVSSLSVSEDHEKILIYCHAGCDWKDILAAMEIEPKELWKEGMGKDIFPTWETRQKEMDQPEAIYDYHNADGTFAYQVLRYPGKRFRQRRLTEDGWEWNMNGVKRVPYRLPQLIDKSIEEVWITEGEKDVDRLNSLFDLLYNPIETATTFVGGANTRNFLASYVKYFINKTVFIVADKDKPGLAYAMEIADALDGVAHSVRVVQAAVGKDISDHLDADKTLDELEEVT